MTTTHHAERSRLLDVLRLRAAREFWTRPEPGSYPCANGCGGRVTFPGVCAPCAERIAEREHNETLRPALRSIPERFRWATLSALNRPEFSGRVRMGSAELAGAGRLLQRRVVVIVGASGRGKTTLACALLRRVIGLGRYGSSAEAYDLARRARFISALEIAEPVPLREFNAQSPEQLATMLPFVVIDDVGQEAGSGSGVRANERTEAVKRVLARRHDRGMRTVVTTFATFAQWSELYGDGVARRYLQSQDADVVVVDLEARNVRAA